MISYERQLLDSISDISFQAEHHTNMTAQAIGARSSIGMIEDIMQKKSDEDMEKKALIAVAKYILRHYYNFNIGNDK